MNKWIKIAAFATGAALVAPSVLGQSVSPNIAGAGGGFVAGGPLGALVGYFAGPAIASRVGGMAGGGSAAGVQTYY